MGIRPEFQVHLLNENGISKAMLLAATFTDTLNEIERLAGHDGREMAIVRTKMEEACFFAKKALANRQENQRDPEV